MLISRWEYSAEKNASKQADEFTTKVHELTNALAGDTKDTLFDQINDFFNNNSINTQEKINKRSGCAGAANSLSEAMENYLAIEGKDDPALFSTINFSSKISDLSNLQSLYSDFKKNLEDKKDFIFSITNIEALREKFGSTTNSFDEFERILTSSTSSTQEVENAFNKLINEWMTGSNVLIGLTAENHDMIVSQLEAAGVMNASKIITEEVVIALKDEKEAADLFNESFKITTGLSPDFSFSGTFDVYDDVAAKLQSLSE